jgi:hypothetical protein
MISQTRRTLAACAALLASVFFAAHANAATIASWSVSGNAGNEVSVAGTTAANVTGASITRGAGLAVAAAGGTFSSTGWATAPAGTPAADTDYMSFQFTVDLGYELSLSQFNINTRSSATGPGNLGLYYSGDGFTSVLYNFNQGSATEQNNTIALTLSGLTGLVEFRIIEIGNVQPDDVTTTSTGTFRVRGNGVFASQGPITFIGEVTLIPPPVVPTPAAMPAAIALLGGLLARRKRRSL